MAGSYLEDVVGGNPAAGTGGTLRVPPARPVGSYLGDLQNSAQERARLTINRFRDTTADVAAYAQQQSDRSPEVLGQPLPAPAFFSEGQVTEAFRRAEAKKRIDALNPRLASWAAADPVNAIMVREYGEELGFLGQATEAFSKGASDLSAEAKSQTFGYGMADRRLRAAEQAREDSQLTTGEIAADTGLTAPIADGPLGTLTRLSNTISRTVASVFAPGDAEIRDMNKKAALELVKYMDAKEQRESDYARGVRVTRVDKRLADIDADKTLGTWEKFGAQLSALAEDPIDGAAWIGTVAMESAPSMAAGAVTTLVTRNPALGAAVSGAGSATLSYGAQYEQIAKDQGFDLRTKEGIEAFVKSPIAREMTRDRTTAYAMTIGIVDGLSGGIAGQQLARSPIGELLLQGIVQAGMGSGGEALARLASDQKLDLFEIAIEGLAELVTVPIEVFGVGGQALSARRREMQSARAAQGFFEALAGNAENSELKAKLPAKYKEAVAELTKNGPVETVQIDASGLNEMFQSGGLTIEDVAKVTGLSAEQIALAVNEGSDLSISTATYAADIAGTPLDKKLREHMRINGSLTAAEMANMDQQNSAIMKDLDASIKEVEAGTKKLAATLEQERTRLTEELTAAGRAPAVAAAEATQLVVFAEVTAKRLGVTVEDFLSDNPLPRVYAPADGTTAIEASVEDLTTLRAAGGPEGLAIEAAARAAGLTEDATNEELADALRAYTTVDVMDAENAGSRIAARDAQSRILNQSSVPTMETPLRVVPTGGKKGETVTIQNIARAFVDDVLAREGRRLDPIGNADDRAKIIEDMMEELKYQLSTSADSGDQWYVEDVAAAMKITEELIPELKDDPTKRTLFLAVAALLSPQNNPVNNWEDAVQAFSGYLRTGELVDRRPTRRKLSKAELEKGVKPGPEGKQLVDAKYGVSSGTALPMLTFLIKQRGELGALEWLLQDHTPRELAEFRRATGIFKDGDQTRRWQEYLPNDVKPGGEPTYGMAAFGPKVSDFMLNATGMDPEAVTVDLWLMRTFGRHRGTLMDAAPKLLAEGGIYDQPTPADRAALDDMITDIARRIGKAPSTVQALLWYYEQKLWRAHGAKADSRNFKQGAEVAAQKRGFNADDLGQGGADAGAQGAPALVARNDSQATEDDLFGTLDERFFGKQGWAILTADKSDLPDSIRVGRNRESEGQLVAELEAAGIPYRRVTGFYGTPEPENSYVILADEETAAKLGKKYGQDSVLTNGGFVYTTGAPKPNTPPTGEFLTGRAAIDSGFYSRDDSGRYFALGMDFEQGPGVAVMPAGTREAEDRPQLPARAVDGKVALYHWSGAQLDTVDPEKVGTGPLKNAIDRGVKQSFWGINPRTDLRAPGTGYVKEARLGDRMHVALVDPDKLYPWFEDPDGLRPTEGTTGQQDVVYRQAIQKAGYLGAYFTDDGTGRTPNGNVAVLYKSVDVTPILSAKDFLSAKTGVAYAQLAPSLDAKVFDVAVRAAQPAATLEELLVRGAAAQEELVTTVGTVAEKLGLAFVNPGPKTRDSLARKVNDKYNGDARRVTDAARGGVTVTTPELADEFVAELGKVARVIDEGWTYASGYMDRKVLVLASDGTLAEIQLWPPGMFEAKEVGGGHKLYEEYRLPETQKDAAKAASLLEQMEELYTAATAAAFKPISKALASASGMGTDRSSVTQDRATEGVQTPSSNTSIEPSSTASRTSVNSAEKNRYKGDTSSDAAGNKGTIDAPATPVNYALADLEKASPGPVEGVRETATKYMREAGLPVRHQASYVRVDPTRAKMVAMLYDRAVDDPANPEVRAAYEALAKETVAQYEALTELGFTFDWIEGEDPYGTPADAIRDMQENKHLWVFPTTSGFGTLSTASDQNPLLQLTDVEISGRQAMVNDLFRIVHDVFGHGSEGASFGARGEENAWQAHVRMFSPLAARAMTAETRGQNSWVNFGPYGEQNRANPKDTVFADQKTTLLPEWVSMVGQADDMPVDDNGNPAPAAVIPPMNLPRGTELFQSSTENPAFKEWFEGSKVVDKDGNPLVVMHGTERGGYRVFNTGGVGKTDGTGAFFSDDIRTAGSYASGLKREIARPLTAQEMLDRDLIEVIPPSEDNPRWTLIDDNEETYEGRSLEDVLKSFDWWLLAHPARKLKGIYYTYLALKDPLEIDAGGSHWARITERDVFAVLNRYDEVLGFFDDRDLAEAEAAAEPGARIEALDDESPWQYMVPDKYFVTTDDIARRAREGDYDGVIIRNVMDYGPFGRGDEMGSVYIAFESTQVKSVHNHGTFDPKDSDIYRQDKRGSIVLPPAGSGRAPVINLFKTADLSTVLHESGHYFLYTYQRLIAGGKASPEIVADYEALKAWWGKNAEKVAKEAGGPVNVKLVNLYLTKGTTGDAIIDAAIYVGMQELFARSYEAYLFEGKAPSDALSRLFDTFSSWLLSVYRKVARLDAPMDPDVRGVFDRMLATEEEIAKAMAKENRPELIAKTAAELGITDAEYAELVKLSLEAQDEARRTLMAEIMAPMQAQARREASARKAELREQVTAEVRRKPVHRVIQWLGNGRWLGDETPAELPAALRMDRQMLIDTYGIGITKELPKGKFPLWLEGSRVAPDEVAMWFGFASGDAMIQALKATPTLEAEIEATLDARLQAEKGDPLVDGTIPDAALSALNGPKRGELIAAELRALGRTASRAIPRTTLSAAREAARRKIATLPIRQAIQYNDYRVASARAAVRAQQALAKGDVDLAYDEKRKEMLNHALFMEARNAADEVEKLEKKVARLKKPGTRKNIDPEYLAAIDEVLDRYDFRRLTASAERRRGSLAAYVEMMEKAGRGNELSIPEKVLKDTKRQPYKTLPFNELRGIYDTLANIEHTGRRKKTLIDAKRQRELDAAVADVVAEASTHLKSRPVPRTEAGESTWRNTLRHYANLLLNADTVLRELDGWTLGKAYDLIKTPIDEAGSVAQTMRTAAAERMEAIYGAYTKAETKEMNLRKDHPTLRTRGDRAAQFSKWDIISMALNMGNADNLARLMDKDNGYGYGQAQIDYIKAQLTAKDWDFVESVWAHIDEYWPLIAEREKRQTGVVPAKVEAVGFELPGGRQIKGGYYPIKYDARIRATVSAEQIAELQMNMMSGRFGKAQTRHGHTKERSGGSGGRVLQLGMEAYHTHISQVIHDLAYSEAVNNAWRVLQHPDMVALFEGTGRSPDRQSLELWVQDVATGTQVAGGALGSLAVKLKNGFTLSKLAFNLSTVLIQFTGVAQSMVVVGKVPFLKAVAEYATGREKWVEIVKSRSAFMSERETTFHKDIFDMQGDTLRGPNASMYQKVQHVVGTAGFWLMTKVQFYGVDMPTWIAGYNNAIAEGKTDADAIQFADRMVARAQASGLQADRSAFERGTLGSSARQQGLVRLFTALGSYMFAKGNIAYERVRRGGAEIDGFNLKSAIAAFSTTFDLALLFTLEAILYNAIKGTLPGGDDEDDDSWAEFLAKETALSIMSTMPIIRDVGSALSGFEPGGAYGSAMDTIFVRPMTQLQQGEFDAALLKALSNAIGAATGLPSAQANRVIDGLWRMSEGEDVAPIEFIMGRRE